MLAKIIIENGQKKLQALTADTGAGAPIGSYLYLEKKSDPAGYLYCDGSTFDETVYPALYAYLGTNVLPDWRELGAKGVGKNTTNIFDSTETDPSTGQAGTQNHDVYTEGEFKDDQVQTHQHYIAGAYSSGNNLKCYNGQTNLAGGGGSYGVINTSGTENALALRNAGGRQGDVTRGKSRGVYIYIKATSGLTESQMDSMITILNEQRSYSTEEINTGKKWIDGKPIYEKTIEFGTLPNTTTKAVAHNVTNIYQVVKVDGIVLGNNFLPLPFCRTNNGIDLWATSTEVKIETYSDRGQDIAYVTIEYTKSS